MTIEENTSSLLTVPCIAFMQLNAVNVLTIFPDVKLFTCIARLFYFEACSALTRCTNATNCECKYLHLKQSAHRFHVRKIKYTFE